MSHRTLGMTVFGILNLLFAAFGVLGLMATAFMLLAVNDLEMPVIRQNPVLELMKNDPSYRQYMMVQAVLRAFSTFLLGLSGLGLLLARGWGRTSGLLYVAVAILSACLGVFVGYRFVLRPALDQLAEVPGDAQAVAQIVSAAVGALLAFAYPIILGIFLQMRGLKTALGLDGESASGDWEGGRE